MRFTVTANRTKVPILDGRVDVDNAADIVVIDRDRLIGPLNGRDIGKDRAALLVRAADRNIL